MNEKRDLTGLLQAWGRGDADALEQLAPLVHSERRRGGFCPASGPPRVGGFSVEETAEALGVSARTVINDWNTARAWLYQAMSARHDDAD